ncbi:putative endopeptidase La [Segatella buccae D17]|nr:putative endopeptidase La [Segatella buccae D17]
MKRKYVRMSLGGVHDEAEIRGHRRTYVGAMPGRIIKSIQKAGTSNPVFILDEIDKVTQSTINGDPSSALLEVLDPEQNNAFHDNYLDVDYDLSKVLFVATANDLNTIPRPLLDRMEVIEVSGYITEEKTEIARRHLVPRELDATGLDKVTPKIKFSKPALEKIIEQYTRESGVRQLEKQINKALRKIAYRKAMDSSLEIPNITPAELEDLLGKPPFYRDIYQGNAYAGVVTGLAWTSVGGEILFIETSLSKGKAGKLTLTGNLGEVMKESAVIALEYVKAHIDKLGVDYRIFDQWNIHIHVPEGATPKDGPSAGITIATSIASALTQRKVRKNTAMTGEITLRGKVLPVGGIKEKILAAKRAGITDIVMCRDNRKDIEEIPEEYRKGVEFHYVENVQDVWDFVLTDELVDNPVDLTVKEEETKGEKEGAK